MGIALRLDPDQTPAWQPAIATSPTRYGETRRPRWGLIASVIGVHVAALVALAVFDVVPLQHRRNTPVLVTLVPDQIVPPPHSALPPAARRQESATDAPIVPQPIVTSAPVSAAPPIVVPPAPPVAAPVAAAMAPVAAPAPPAPILPPDGNAATLRNPPPVYPIESRRRHEQGIVRLRVLITAGGAVKEISVARTSGFDRLDQAALEAVRHWHFLPGTQAGVPVEAVGVVPIPFRLT